MGGLGSRSRCLGQVEVTLEPAAGDEGGQELYDRIEAVRQASVAYHRDPASHDAAELEGLLKDLSLDQAIGLTHGFAAFSLLANVAEDRAGKRRARNQDRKSVV